MKVKVFEEFKPENLETEINAFLEKVDNVEEVIAIKYSSHSINEYWTSPQSGEARLEGSSNVYTALIIYK